MRTQQDALSRKRPCSTWVVHGTTARGAGKEASCWMDSAGVVAAAVRREPGDPTRRGQVSALPQTHLPRRLGVNPGGEVPAVSGAVSVGGLTRRFVGVAGAGLACKGVPGHACVGLREAGRGATNSDFTNSQTLSSGS